MSGVWVWRAGVLSEYMFGGSRSGLWLGVFPGHSGAMIRSSRDDVALITVMKSGSFFC